MVQYGRFLVRLGTGDLGTSVRTRQPVADDIGKYLPASVELGAVAMVVGILLAAGFALLQLALRRSGAVRLVLLATGSAPIFLTALLLAYVLWFKLGWLPGSGRLSARGFTGPTGLNVIDGVLAGRFDVSLDALRHLILRRSPFRCRSPSLWAAA